MAFIFGKPDVASINFFLLYFLKCCEAVMRARSPDACSSEAAQGPSQEPGIPPRPLYLLPASQACQQTAGSEAEIQLRTQTKHFKLVM